MCSPAGAARLPHDHQLPPRQAQDPPQDPPQDLSKDPPQDPPRQHSDAKPAAPQFFLHEPALICVLAITLLLVLKLAPRRRAQPAPSFIVHIPPNRVPYRLELPTSTASPLPLAPAKKEKQKKKNTPPPPLLTS